MSDDESVLSCDTVPTHKYVQVRVKNKTKGTVDVMKVRRGTELKDVLAMRPQRRWELVVVVLVGLYLWRSAHNSIRASVDTATAQVSQHGLQVRADLEKNLKSHPGRDVALVAFTALAVHAHPLLVAPVALASVPGVQKTAKHLLDKTVVAVRRALLDLRAPATMDPVAL